MRRAAAVRPLLQSTPMRRGAAALVATSGAFSLLAVTAPTQIDLTQAAAAARLPTQLPEDRSDEPSDDESDESTDDGSDDGSEERVGDGIVMLPAVSPVLYDQDELDDQLDDTTEMVRKALQMGEELAARLAEEAERAAEEAEEQAERAAEEVERAAEEAERAAEEAARPAAADTDCGIDTGQLGAVKANVREAATFLGCTYDIETMHGVAGRGGTSDHPSGRAVDFMVKGPKGDALADCALQNMDAIGASYVIWEQRINHGDGWENMADRGGVTANHFDHVHISFDGGGGGGLAPC